MNILILGSQGSGKGTQARLLAEKYGFTYFEAGNFLRELSTKNHELKSLLAQGKLVPDEEMSSYVQSYFDEKGVYDDIVFDGFPRTLTQYNFFKKWLEDKTVSLDIVFVLRISEEEAVRRLTARREDPQTGKIYNLISEPPPKSISTSSLIQRSDDKPGAIKKRLEWHKKLARPMIEAIKSDTKVIEIDGERPIAEIFESIERALSKFNGKNLSKN